MSTEKQEKKESAETKDLQSKIQDAYSKLDEKSKRTFFKFLQKRNPDTIQNIHHYISQKIKGIQPSTIVNRSNQQIAKEVDSSFLKPDNISYLIELLSNFVFSTSRESSTWIEENFKLYRGNPESFQAKMLSATKGDSFNEIYYILWEILPDEMKVKIVQTSRMRIIESKLEEIEHIGNKIKELAKRLENVIDFDKKNAIEMVENAHSLIISLKENLITVGKECKIENVEWRNKQELEEIIKSIETNIENSGNSSENLAAFLSGLSDLLKNLVIRHRSEKECERFKELRDKSANELQTAASSKKSFSFEGPKEPLAWLKWIGQKSGEELAAQGKVLEKQDLPSTARFIDVFDPGWIPAEDSLDKAPKESPAAREDISLSTAMDEVEPTNDPRADSRKSSEISSPSVAPSLNIHGPESKDATQPCEIIVESLKAESLDNIAKEDVRELARRTKATKGDRPFDELTWNLIDSDEMSAAFLINSSSSVNSNDLMANVIEALILSPHASIDQMKVANRLQTVFERLCIDPKVSINQSLSLRTLDLMLFAASLQSAICLPHLNGIQILTSLRRLGEFPALRQLIQSTESYARMGIPLNLDLIIKSLNEEDQKKEFLKLQTEAKNWWEGRSQSKFNYQTATTIWREWMKRDQPVWKLVKPLIDGRQSDIRTAGSLKIDFDKEMDAATKKLGKKVSLVGQARNDLMKHAEEAQSFALRASQYIESGTQGESHFKKSHFIDFKKHFEQNAGKAIREMEGLADDPGSSFVLRLAVKRAIIAIARVESILTKLFRTNSGIDPHLLTHEFLLRLPAVSLDTNWKSGLAVNELRETIIEGLITGVDSTETAFKRHLSSGDLLSAQRLLEFISASSIAEEDSIRKLQDEKDKAAITHLTQLETEIEKTEKDFLLAERKGTFKYNTAMRISEDIDKIKNAIRLSKEGIPIESFSQFKEILKEVRRILTSDRENKTNEARGMLDKLKLRDDEKQRIEEVIANGDFHLAFDYLERKENKLPLPEDSLPESPALFLKYFPDENFKEKPDRIFDELYKRFERTKDRDIDVIEDIKQGRDFGGMHLREIPRGQLQTHGQVLETWFEIKRLRKIQHVDKIKQVLNGLGFNVLERRMKEVGDKTWIHVTTDIVPVSDARPIAEYGSGANGRYTIYCTFARPSEENLVGVFDNSPFPKSANIIFYFGRMTSSARRKLANHCRRQKKTIIVLDDILMVFLSSIRGSKISAMLELTVPLTYLMPYTTQGSILAPEMLYGRERETRELQSLGADGSCLLYGGRQIGKTVLLKHVERVTHNPDKGAIARYIDLKDKGIGYTNPPEMIWKTMAEVIHPDLVDVFPQDLPRNVNAEYFRGKVEKWLENPERRILLLLDEADAFLTADGEKDGKFLICTSLKGLMEKTERRFKVVLAGLHNVQRSTRVANNPIAHFGKPVCVGPLMHGTDALAAQALIEQPLRFLGLFFNDSTLPIRILARANYYPNLIQIYCNNLVHMILAKPSLQNSEKFPPYLIESADIDELYDQKSLRDDLRHRFALTLELDARFKLIAHILALYNDDYPQGLDLEHIREHAMDFWPQGFIEHGKEGVEMAGRSISNESFRDLLDEMVGLGILRCQSNGSMYKLRSPNVVSLLGSPEEIEGILDDAVNWMRPAQYEAKTYRDAISDDRIRRSPFTAIQESELKSRENKVFILVGTSALGSDDLNTALERSFGKALLVIAGETEMERFTERLDDFSKKRREPNSIVFVTKNSKWDHRWVERATKKLEMLKLPDINISIAFECDHERLWRDWDYFISAEMEKVKSIQLQPWSESTVRYWMKDSQVQLSDQDVKEFCRITGQWPLIINDLAQFDRSKPLNAVLLRQFEATYLEKNASKNLLRAFGLNVAECKPVLDILAELDEYTPVEDIAEYLILNRMGLSVDEIRKCLAWGDRLSIVTRNEDKWKLDPMIRKLLLLKPTTVK